MDTPTHRAVDTILNLKTHTQARLHVHMPTCAHMHTHAPTYAHTRSRVRVRMCGCTRLHALAHARVRAHIRACTRWRMRAPTRLGERYAVPRPVIRRITTRDTPYLF